MTSKFEDGRGGEGRGGDGRAGGQEGVRGGGLAHESLDRYAIGEG